MSRSKPVRTVLSLAVVGLLLAGAAFAFTGSASAGDVDGVTYAGVTNLENESPDGQVSAIEVGAAGTVEWENLPDDAKRVKVELATNAGEDGEYQTFAQSNYWSVPRETDGTYKFDRVHGDVIGNTSFEADTFSAAEDGETEERMFPVRVTVKVVDSNGDVHKHVQYHKVTTNVTNVGEPSVGAEKTIDGRIIMSDTEADETYDPCNSTCN